MFRLTQIIRNSFIRLQGFLSYRLRQFFAFLYQLFSFFSKIFGFTESAYFLEDKAQNIKAETKQQAEAELAQAPSAPAATRRRPDAKMDYYLKLAQPKKTSR
jgi:hypothetical protein